MAVYNSNIQPNVKQSSAVLAAQPSEMGVREMSSLEIADITGKQHAHVMRDIRTLIEQGVNESNFGLVDYTDKKGEKRSMYNLTKKGCLILASGYNAVLREKIINRWEALETGQAEPMYHQPKQEQLTMKDKMNAATWAAKFLNLNDASKLLMAQQILAPTGLILPEYTSSKGFLLSADKLLKNHGVGMTSHAFNLAMEDKGLVTYRERPSKSKGIKRFPILTNKGLKYGENQVHPKCQQQTQIRYYEDKFEELLKVLKLK
jgi:Rha family phage regulatory protein